MYLFFLLKAVLKEIRPPLLSPRSSFFHFLSRAQLYYYCLLFDNIPHYGLAWNNKWKIGSTSCSCCKGGKEKETLPQRQGRKKKQLEPLSCLCSKVVVVKNWKGEVGVGWVHEKSLSKQSKHVLCVPESVILSPHTPQCLTFDSSVCLLIKKHSAVSKKRLIKRFDTSGISRRGVNKRRCFV